MDYIERNKFSNNIDFNKEDLLILPSCRAMITDCKNNNDNSNSCSIMRQCERTVRYPGCRYCGLHFLSLKDYLFRSQYKVIIQQNNNQCIQDSNHYTILKPTNTTRSGYSVFIQTARKGDPVVYYDGKYKNKLKECDPFFRLFFVLL